MTHYFEEEAVKSYTDYLELIKNKQLANPPAPLSAIKYYNLKDSARLSDMIECIRADEQKHADVNLSYSNVKI
jgi:ubiquinol oxidase